MYSKICTTKRATLRISDPLAYLDRAARAAARDRKANLLEVSNEGFRRRIVRTQAFKDQQRCWEQAYPKDLAKVMLVETALKLRKRIRRLSFDELYAQTNFARAMPIELELLSHHRFPAIRKEVALSLGTATETKVRLLHDSNMTVRRHAKRGLESSLRLLFVKRDKELTEATLTEINAIGAALENGRRNSRK